MKAETVIDRERELAHRIAAGLEVTLYWNAADNSTSIEIHLVASDTTLRCPVPAEEALHAFYHPLVHVRYAAEP